MQNKKCIGSIVTVTEGAAATGAEAKEAAANFQLSEEELKYAAMQCSLDNPEGCEMCGS